MKTTPEPTPEEFVACQVTMRELARLLRDSDLSMQAQSVVACLLVREAFAACVEHGAASFEQLVTGLSLALRANPPAPGDPNVWSAPEEAAH